MFLVELNIASVNYLATGNTRKIIIIIKFAINSILMKCVLRIHHKYINVNKF